MLWMVALLGLLSALPAADHSVPPIVSRIPRHSVESSALRTVGYSERLRALEIEFQDGSVYRYLEVPAGIHRSLLRAESKATYYNRKIRGKYHCLRVRPRRHR